MIKKKEIIVKKKIVVVPWIWALQWEVQRKVFLWKLCIECPGYFLVPHLLICLLVRLLSNHSFFSLISYSIIIIAIIIVVIS